MTVHNGMTRPDANGVYHIPFIEYVRPRGARRDLQWMTRDKALAAKADAIITNGFVFEIERLGGDIVSATITHRDVGDLGHVLAHNNADLTTKITAMIERFDIVKQTAHVKEMQQ